MWYQTPSQLESNIDLPADSIITGASQRESPISNEGKKQTPRKIEKSSSPLKSILRGNKSPILEKQGRVDKSLEKLKEEILKAATQISIIPSPQKLVHNKIDAFAAKHSNKKNQ